MWWFLLGHFLKPSKLCILWWILPHVFFRNAFLNLSSEVVCSYFNNFTEVGQMYIFDYKWVSEALRNISCMTIHCNLRYLEILFHKNLRLRLCVRVRLRDLVHEKYVHKHRTCVWKCVFLTSKRPDKGTLSRPMIQYPAHSPWFLTWGKDLSVFWQAP